MGCSWSGSNWQQLPRRSQELQVVQFELAEGRLSPGNILVKDHTLQYLEVHKTQSDYLLKGHASNDCQAAKQQE
jgi:hypothetical protein